MGSCRPGNSSCALSASRLVTEDSRGSPFGGEVRLCKPNLCRCDKASTHPQL